MSMDQEPSPPPSAAADPVQSAELTPVELTPVLGAGAGEAAPPAILPAVEDDDGFSDEPPGVEAQRDHPLFAPVVAALRDVFDPEIPVNIYELGLIYRIGFDDPARKVDVVMTLTSPHCPVAADMPDMVKDAIGTVEGIDEIAVDIVWDPTWNPSFMAETAKIQLNMW